MAERAAECAADSAFISMIELAFFSEEEWPESEDDDDAADVVDNAPKSDKHSLAIDATSRPCFFVFYFFQIANSNFENIYLYIYIPVYIYIHYLCQQYPRHVILWSDHEEH